MKDRDVPAAAVKRALEQLGCEVSIVKGFLTARRSVGGRLRVAKQHLHRGAGDIVRRSALRTLYKHRLGFTPEEFYAAADAG